ncbi:uncharacterized protein LOC108668737, partial [Hyalella azteca]|uniref:Uncharacterized protein LOC108668737 n=1 Tax=Hyalella azteca TaxID=294128 RepID=A0A8B7NCZ9_HYAAZ
MTSMRGLRGNRSKSYDSLDNDVNDVTNAFSDVTTRDDVEITKRSSNKSKTNAFRRRIFGKKLVFKADNLTQTVESNGKTKLNSKKGSSKSNDDRSLPHHEVENPFNNNFLIEPESRGCHKTDDNTAGAIDNTDGRDHADSSASQLSFGSENGEKCDKFMTETPRSLSMSSLPEDSDNSQDFDDDKFYVKKGGHFGVKFEKKASLGTSKQKRQPNVTNRNRLSDGLNQLKKNVEQVRNPNLKSPKFQNFKAVFGRSSKDKDKDKSVDVHTDAQHGSRLTIKNGDDSTEDGGQRNGFTPPMQTDHLESESEKAKKTKVKSNGFSSKMKAAFASISPTKTPPPPNARSTELRDAKLEDEFDFDANFYSCLENVRNDEFPANDSTSSSHASSHITKQSVSKSKNNESEMPSASSDHLSFETSRCSGGLSDFSCDPFTADYLQPFDASSSSNFESFDDNFCAVPSTNLLKSSSASLIHSSNTSQTNPFTSSQMNPFTASHINPFTACQINPFSATVIDQSPEHATSNKKIQFLMTSSPEGGNTGASAASTPSLPDFMKPQPKAPDGKDKSGCASDEKATHSSPTDVANITSMNGRLSKSISTYGFIENSFDMTNLDNVPDGLPGTKEFRETELPTSRRSPTENLLSGKPLPTKKHQQRNLLSASSSNLLELTPKFDRNKIAGSLMDCSRLDEEADDGAGISRPHRPKKKMLALEDRATQLLFRTVGGSRRTMGASDHLPEEISLLGDKLPALIMAPVVGENADAEK